MRQAYPDWFLETVLGLVWGVAFVCLSAFLYFAPVEFAALTLFLVVCRYVGKFLMRDKDELQ